MYRIYPAKPVMGEMWHYYLINYLITEVYTQSPDTAKVTIEKSDSECCANTLYICEHNQSIPNTTEWHYEQKEQVWDPFST